MSFNFTADDLNDLKAIMREAGIMACEMRMDPEILAKVGTKPDDSIFTYVDPAIEKFVGDKVKARFGGGMNGEEFGSDASDDEQQWHLDPIDGTTNYSLGTAPGGFPACPAWCVSLGMRQKGVPQVGVIYIPDTDQLYFAVKGQGAWVESTKFGKTNTYQLKLPEHYSGKRVNLGMGIIGNTTMSQTAVELYQGFKEAVRGKVNSFTSRTIGATAIDCVNVAAGVYGAHVTVAALHDVAAAEVIIAEAGGRTSILHQKGDKFYFVASHAEIHDQMVTSLNNALGKPDIRTNGALRADEKTNKLTRGE